MKNEKTVEIPVFCDILVLKFQFEEENKMFCKNCGAEMNKTPVYVDEILNVNNTSASSNQMTTRVLKKLGLVALLTVLPWLITMMVVFFIVLKSNLQDTRSGHRLRDHARYHILKFQSRVFQRNRGNSAG